MIQGHCEERVNEIMKYSTKTPQEADIIITWYRESRNKYNKMMMDYYNKKNLSDKGTKVICRTNKKEVADFGIYNNFKFIVGKRIGDEIELINQINEKTVIPITLFKKKGYFEAGYATTSYSTQGNEFQKYYFVKEDFFDDTTKRCKTNVFDK